MTRYDNVEGTYFRMYIKLKFAVNISILENTKLTNKLCWYSNQPKTILSFLFGTKYNLNVGKIILVFLR